MGEEHSIPSCAIGDDPEAPVDAEVEMLDSVPVGQDFRWLYEPTGIWKLLREAGGPGLREPCIRCGGGETQKDGEAQRAFLPPGEERGLLGDGDVARNRAHVLVPSRETDGEVARGAVVGDVTRKLAVGRNAPLLWGVLLVGLPAAVGDPGNMGTCDTVDGTALTCD